MVECVFLCVCGRAVVACVMVCVRECVVRLLCGCVGLVGWLCNVWLRVAVCACGGCGWCGVGVVCVVFVVCLVAVGCVLLCRVSVFDCLCVRFV